MIKKRSNPVVGKRIELAHLGSRVNLVQVKYELGQILNRVDVVVRRRRDESDARLRQTEGGDVLVDLGAGELSTLAGLCTLEKITMKRFRV